MTVALILGLLILAVIFGWAAGKVRSLAMAVVLQMGCFIFLALAVIVAGAAITGTGGAGWRHCDICWQIIPSCKGAFASL